jgi:hypothetical protein
MTRFASPQTIACPHCQAPFLRAVLCSFNNRGQIVFSDGNTRGGLQNILTEVGRCTSCKRVINNIQTLPIKDTDTQKGMFSKLFAKWFNHKGVSECNYLSAPTFDEYAELFENENELKSKRKWAVEASRAYHHAFCLSSPSTQLAGSTLSKIFAESASSYQRHLFTLVSDFVLANPINPIVDEYTLLCADILRLRGEFQAAKVEYGKVWDPKFDHIIERGKAWCDAQNTCLMVLDL